MCPSFRATREEKHTTRGRTGLLFEMMRGDVIAGGWKSEEIKEALDLCLGCKGCKGDCPVSVDVATYKAEFLSHYYEGRIRPPEAYAMGYIYRWAQLGSISPGLANAFLKNKTFARMLGFSEKRTLPGLSAQTFQNWWEKRTRNSASLPKRRVMSGPTPSTITSGRKPPGPPPRFSKVCPMRWRCRSSNFVAEGLFSTSA